MDLSEQILKKRMNLLKLKKIIETDLSKVTIKTAFKFISQWNSLTKLQPNIVINFDLFTTIKFIIVVVSSGVHIQYSEKIQNLKSLFGHLKRTIAGGLDNIVVSEISAIFSIGIFAHVQHHYKIEQIFHIGKDEFRINLDAGLKEIAEDIQEAYQFEETTLIEYFIHESGIREHPENMIRRDKLHLINLLLLDEFDVPDFIINNSALMIIKNYLSLILIRNLRSVVKSIGRDFNPHFHSIVKKSIVRGNRLINDSCIPIMNLIIQLIYIECGLIKELFIDLNEILYLDDIQLLSKHQRQLFIKFLIATVDIFKDYSVGKRDHAEHLATLKDFFTNFPSKCLLVLLEHAINDNSREIIETFVTLNYLIDIPLNDVEELLAALLDRITERMDEDEISTLPSSCLIFELILRMNLNLRLKVNKAMYTINIIYLKRLEESKITLPSALFDLFISFLLYFDPSFLLNLPLIYTLCTPSLSPTSSLSLYLLSLYVALLPESSPLIAHRYNGSIYLGSLGGGGILASLSELGSGLGSGAPPPPPACVSHVFGVIFNGIFEQITKSDRFRPKINEKGPQTDARTLGENCANNARELLDYTHQCEHNTHAVCFVKENSLVEVKDGVAFVRRPDGIWRFELERPRNAEDIFQVLVAEGWLEGSQIKYVPKTEKYMNMIDDLDQTSSKHHMKVGIAYIPTKDEIGLSKHIYKPINSILAEFHHLATPPQFREFVDSLGHDWIKNSEVLGFESDLLKVSYIVASKIEGSQSKKEFSIIRSLGNCYVNVYWIAKEGEYIECEDQVISSNVTLVELRISHVTGKYYKVISKPKKNISSSMGRIEGSLKRGDSLFEKQENFTTYPAELLTTEFLFIESIENLPRLIKVLSSFFSLVAKSASLKLTDCHKARSIKIKRIYESINDSNKGIISHLSSIFEEFQNIRQGK